jgi:hypothetical protein
VSSASSQASLNKDGTVDPTSGTLSLYRWEPQDDDLDPLAYDFSPPEGMAIEGI